MVIILHIKILSIAHASFNQEVTYTQHPLYQVEEGSAGTRMVFVYQFIDEKVYVIHQEEEFYDGYTSVLF